MENTSGAAVTDVVVTDDLSAIIGTVVNFLPDVYDPGDFDIAVTAPSINGGAQQFLTDAADADEGELAGNVVTVRCGGLAAGETATVTFQVEVR